MAIVMTNNSLVGMNHIVALSVADTEVATQILTETRARGYPNSQRNTLTSVIE